MGNQLFLGMAVGEAAVSTDATHFGLPITELFLLNRLHSHSKLPGQCAVSSVVEHYLDTADASNAEIALKVDLQFKNAVLNSSDARNLSNTLSNGRQRFARVERCLRRNIYTGELWYVGRIQGKVRWQRLKTSDLSKAKKQAAMINYTNGNTQITIIDSDGVRTLPEIGQASHFQPAPEIRLVRALVDAEHPGMLQKRLPTTVLPSLRDMLTRWRAGKGGLAEGTTKKLDSHISTVSRYIDLQRTIQTFTAQDIRDAVAKARAAKLKGQTINENILRLLSNGFDLAVEEGVIKENPVKRVKREKIVPIKRKQLGWSDAQRVLDAVKLRSTESALILRAMLILGIGQAECKSLTGSSIDWKAKKVHFIRRKTGQSYEVPIYPWTEQFLRDLEPRFQAGKPIFEWRNPRKVFETSCRDCGFEPLEIRSLRRTLIVHLLEKGVEPRLIASWQGHADSALIHKVYGKHINAAHEQAALDKLAV